MTISSEPSAPLVAVVGATGLQGGSVINHLAGSVHPYRIRGLTRDITKPKAQALSARGVEVVSCNINVNHVDQVKDAFQGATYIFIVTNYWEHLDGAREEAEGKLMVDCAAEAGVKLLVISSLPNVTKATGGELTHVYHFDSKASIAEHAKSIGVPYVEVQPGAYMNNFTSFMRPQRQEDGSFVFPGTWSPDTRLPLLDAHHDYGIFVQLAIESEEYNKGDGKIISAYSELLSLVDQAKILSEVVGRTVRFQHTSEDQSRKDLASFGMPAHVIDDMMDMNKFQERVWERVLVYTDLSQLPRPPRTFKEYCEHEDWSTVFADPPHSV
ncbi:NAD(P)-binding protein [Xylariales sp. PMI_506]|nr:NAD(P)-binding protein [Xylariales sp. PMI_506]